jgi:hypothetical protein
VVTEKYTTMYGEVVNALMDVKHQASKISDYFINQMGIPSPGW